MAVISVMYFKKKRRKKKERKIKQKAFVRFWTKVCMSLTVIRQSDTHPFLQSAFAKSDSDLKPYTAKTFHKATHLAASLYFSLEKKKKMS